MTLLARVSALLASQGMPFALIGAAAMAAHGVGRSTLDRDLLVHDPRVLSEAFWADLSGAAADVRLFDEGRGRGKHAVLAQHGVDRGLGLAVGHGAPLGVAARVVTPREGCKLEAGSSGRPPTRRRSRGGGRIRRRWPRRARTPC